MGGPGSIYPPIYKVFERIEKRRFYIIRFLPFFLKTRRRGTPKKRLLGAHVQIIQGFILFIAQIKKPCCLFWTLQKSIFRPKGRQKGYPAIRGNHPGADPGAIWRRKRSKVEGVRPYTRFWTDFGWIWIDFGRFWMHFGSILHHFSIDFRIEFRSIYNERKTDTTSQRQGHETKK